jgi:hypothetical protein
MATTSSPACSTCGPWWRLPLLLALVLAAVLFSRAVREPTTEPASDSSASQLRAETGESISLAVDFGDRRRQQYEPIVWRDGMTVRDALAAAADSSGSATFAQQGSGEAAFLTQIDGVENEGADGRNWTYTVNGKLGDRSFAIYPLRPGDQVLWTFAAGQ